MAALALGLVVAPVAIAAGPRTYYGDPVAIGNGTGRVVVAANSAGVPTSVSVALSAAALTGLPAGSATVHEVEYELAMPARAPKTGIDHVAVDWNPHGHPPAGVYTVPHFDFHFYAISRDEQARVTFVGEGGDAKRAVPDASLIPAGYVVPPDTAVEKMGVHGVDPAGPEFHGKPFTSTFIYGYYAGRLTFVEPMAALSFLQSKPDVTLPVKTPARYSVPGYYPTKYRVGYDAERDEYRIGLLALKPRGGVKTAAVQ